jgi:hypothetical protein
MNSLRKLLLAKSILAAAVASSGIAAPVVSQAITVAGGPASGMACRTGYAADFSGTNLKCKKSGSITIALICAEPNFPTYVNRVASAPDGGKDVCARDPSKPAYVAISSNGPLPGSGWVYAVIDTAKAATRVVKAGEEEAVALGLPASGVQTVQSISFPDVNAGAGGVKDVSHTQLIHYTFAVPVGGPIVIGNPGPVGLPATANSTSAFVPRPLPR